MSLVTLSDGLALSFDGNSSGLMYNLYADKLLGLNIFNSSVSILLAAPKLYKLNDFKVYDHQTGFYNSFTSKPGFQSFGWHMLKLEIDKWQYGIPMDVSNSSSIARAGENRQLYLLR